MLRTDRHRARLAAILLLLSAVTGFGQMLPGARFLVIADDSFADIIQPLADWRTSTGLQAAVVPLSVAGRTPTAVRGYIQNAWATWPVKPEYVLLACHPDVLPGFNYQTDCPFGDMTGDYRMEIPVGRLPGRDRSEYQTMVAKCLAYERADPVTDTSWYLKGTTVIGEDSPDSLYWPDSRLCHDLWRSAGYRHIDSLWNRFGDSTRHLLGRLNDGRCFITYRGVAGGYWYPSFVTFRPDSTWQNGPMMPVILSATCATVTLGPGEEMLGDRSVRFGSPYELGGAVAFFGTTRLDMHVSEFRSACYRGFLKALFEEGAGRLGPATLRGRWRVDSLYGRREYYEEWNLLGDPALRVWTGAPRTVTVSHPAAVGTGTQTFAVTVSHRMARSSDSLAEAEGPVPYAMVCVRLDSVVYAVGTTDASGQARLEINPTHPGDMSVCITGRDIRPYAGSCEVRTTGGSFLTYLRHAVNDSPPRGNGDGLITAGESPILPLWVKNLGDSAARSVVGTLRCADTLCTVLDSVRPLGTVPGYDSAGTGDSGFRCLVSSRCPDGHALRFDLELADSMGRTWQACFSANVLAAYLSVAGQAVRDSAANNNGRLDPGETAEFVITLRNGGSAPSESTNAVLRSTDPRLLVPDSTAYYGTVPGHSTRANESDRFTLAALSMMPETRISCTLHVRSRQCSTALDFTITVGRVTGTDPIPDGPRTPPLYWAYDDVDTAYPQRPVYDWVELRGTGTKLNLSDNQTTSLALPSGFGPFVFYGQRYDTISVCANGFVAPGRSGYNAWHNYPLPRGSGPPLLCPHWDDFVPMLGNNVWYGWDSLSRRLVVEWDSVHYRLPATHFDKFELVIFDSTCRAQDGNSVFLFQYHTANWHKTGTVGIQDYTGRIGITVLLESTYNRAAARLAPGRCIKFTTDAPFPGAAEPAELHLAGAGLELVVRPTVMRASARISFNLPGRNPAELTIIDITGRRVRTFQVSGAKRGTHSVVWDGTDDYGRRLPAGVYLCRLSSPGRSAVAKLTLQR